MTSLNNELTVAILLSSCDIWFYYDFHSIHLLFCLPHLVHLPLPPRLVHLPVLLHLIHYFVSFICLHYLVLSIHLYYLVSSICLYYCVHLIAPFLTAISSCRPYSTGTSSSRPYSNQFHKFQEVVANFLIAKKDFVKPFLFYEHSQACRSSSIL